MLRALGVIYYVCAAVLALLFVAALAEGNRRSGYGGFGMGGFGAMGMMTYFLGSIWFAFFGAMCTAADDIKTLLSRIADRNQPASGVSPQAEQL